MIKFDEVIRLYKNPIDIRNNIYKEYSKQFNDTNSYIWDSLLQIHYNSYKNFKKDFISFREYYILIYTSELLGINDLRIINRCQDVLNIIPRLYDGDIVCILNACCNTAILSGKYNLHLFRKKNINSQCRTFGEGLLKYEYVIHSNDFYLDEKVNILKDNKISSLNGCYDPY